MSIFRGIRPGASHEGIRGKCSTSTHFYLGRLEVIDQLLAPAALILEKNLWINMKRRLGGLQKWCQLFGKDKISLHCYELNHVFAVVRLVPLSLYILKFLVINVQFRTHFNT